METTGVARRFFLYQAGYGAFFLLLLPLALISMARSIDLPLPAYQMPALGAFLALSGGLCMAVGAGALVRLGRGLPMNAFPPDRLVTRGLYALLPHPIYCGFVLTVAGAALHAGSASGLWLITPLCALGCAALVWGHERLFLHNRHHLLARPLLGLPERHTMPRRFGLMAGVLLPWLILFYGIKFLGAPPDAVTLQLPGEADWPVLLWTYPIYASAYLFIPLAFFLAPDREAERLFRRGWTSLAVMGLCYLCLPLVSPVRPFVPDSPLGQLLLLEMQGAAPYTAAFPSYHVVWSVLAAAAVAGRGRLWAVASWALALAISLSCVTTGMHVFIDLPAGLLAGWLLCRQERLWGRLLNATERLANAFTTRRMGRYRILSHAPWSFLAGFLCLFLPCLLLGGAAAPQLLLLLLVGLLAAAFWGQALEGGSPLQRPFGYFGSVLGLLCVGGVLLLAGKPVWPLLAAVACSSPWIQAAGRVRCLVQGCCHGRHVADGPPTPLRQGITVTNPHSRVVHLSQLHGREIYPTQLYSILGNLVMGLLLFRAWTLGAPAGLLCGLYFILSGALRFVEEGYRGETQTPRCLGLPVYQWLAVLMAALGCWLATLSTPPVPPAAWAWLPALLWGLPAAALITPAMSIDLPTSTRRFARLSG